MGYIVTEIELIRSTEWEKGLQIANALGFQQLGDNRSPAASVAAASVAGASGNRGLAYLQMTARDPHNVFAALMDAVKTHPWADQP